MNAAEFLPSTPFPPPTGGIGPRALPGVRLVETLFPVQCTERPLNDQGRALNVNEFMDRGGVLEDYNNCYLPDSVALHERYFTSATDHNTAVAYAARDDEKGIVYNPAPPGSKRDAVVHIHRRNLMQTMDKFRKFGADGNKPGNGGPEDLRTHVKDAVAEGLGRADVEVTSDSLARLTAGAFRRADPAQEDPPRPFKKTEQLSMALTDDDLNTKIGGRSWMAQMYKDTGLRAYEVLETSGDAAGPAEIAMVRTQRRVAIDVVEPSLTKRTREAPDAAAEVVADPPVYALPGKFTNTGVFPPRVVAHDPARLPGYQGALGSAAGEVYLTNVSYPTPTDEGTDDAAPPAPPTGKNTPKRPEKGEDPHWIECMVCNKWRLVWGKQSFQKAMALYVEKRHWDCPMNTWDPEHNKCEDAQEVPADTALGGRISEMEKNKADAAQELEERAAAAAAAAAASAADDSAAKAAAAAAAATVKRTVIDTRWMDGPAVRDELAGLSVEVLATLSFTFQAGVTDPGAQRPMPEAAAGLQAKATADNPMLDLPAQGLRNVGLLLNDQGCASLAGSLHQENDPNAAGWLVLIGFWHYKWALLCVIYKVYWHRGLCYLVTQLLKRVHITLECKLFTPANEALAHVKEGAWRAMIMAFKRSQHFAWCLDKISDEIERLAVDDKADKARVRRARMSTRVQEIMVEFFFEWYVAGVEHDEEFALWAGLVFGIGAVYRDLDHAIRAEDGVMLRELNKLCFGAFSAAGKVNYRKYCMQFETALLEYPQEIVGWGMSNLSGSLTGKPGHSVAVDLIQETAIKVIKTSGASGLANKAAAMRFAAAMPGLKVAYDVLDDFCGIEAHAALTSRWVENEREGIEVVMKAFNEMRMFDIRAEPGPRKSLVLPEFYSGPGMLSDRLWPPQSFHLNCPSAYKRLEQSLSDARRHREKMAENLATALAAVAEARTVVEESTGGGGAAESGDVEAQKALEEALRQLRLAELDDLKARHHNLAAVERAVILVETMKKEGHMMAVDHARVKASERHLQCWNMAVWQVQPSRERNAALEAVAAAQRKAALDAETQRMDIDGEGSGGDEDGMSYDGEGPGESDHRDLLNSYNTVFEDGDDQLDAAWAILQLGQEVAPPVDRTGDPDEDDLIQFVGGGFAEEEDEV